jgi:adenosylcobinamide-GDP ribazoletransferase
MAFSMFSKIPMPYTDWKPESMRYMFCVFPLVGAVAGGIVWGWSWAAGAIPLGGLLFAAGCVILPILFTGGIHLDGFCDTTDALRSYGGRDKKLAILKDPHIGAFAMMYTGVYLLALLGLYSELDPSRFILIPAVMALSRTLGGWATVSWPNAKPDGLSRTFSDSAQKRPVQVWLILWTLGILGFAAYMDWMSAAAMLLVAVLIMVYTRRMAVIQFGGVTGDIVGYFIQVSELAMLTGLLVVQVAGGLL